MSNDCSHIDEFYQSLEASGKYEPIVSQKTFGLFSGTRSSYSVPTSDGFVKIKCDSGLNTLGWSYLNIMNSVPGNSTGLTSEGSSFFAKYIKPLDPNGFLQVDTLTSSATVQLPYPKDVDVSTYKHYRFIHWIPTVYK